MKKALAIVFGSLALLFVIRVAPALAVECIKSSTPSKIETLPGSECSVSCKTGFRAAPGFTCLDPGGTGASTCCVPDVSAEIAGVTCKGSEYYCATSCSGSSRPETSKTCPSLEGEKNICCFKVTKGYSDKTLPDPLGGADIPTVIGRVIRTFLGIVGGLALLVFVYAGVMYMTAAGEPKKIQGAVDTMKYGIIGLVLIVFAYVITDFYFKALIQGGS